MYYLLDHVYKIATTRDGKPQFYALFSISTDTNTVATFQEDSIEALANLVKDQVDKLKINPENVEATFDTTRKYSNKGGTIKYQSPFTESEEKTFLALLTKTD